MKKRIQENRKAKGEECKQYRRMIKRQSALLQRVYDNIAKQRATKSGK